MLKREIHIAEVDLNYTQYCPLSERYISLYPPKQTTDITNEDSNDTKLPNEKPPMWAEVEKCMADGTLDRLRNKVPNAPRPNLTNSAKHLERKTAKAKPEPTPVETAGLNRRERRRLHGTKDLSSKIKYTALGTLLSGMKDDMGAGQEDDSDGGFFEE